MQFRAHTWGREGEGREEEGARSITPMLEEVPSQQPGSCQFCERRFLNISRHTLPIDTQLDIVVDHKKNGLQNSFDASISIGYRFFCQPQRPCLAAALTEPGPGYIAPPPQKSTLACHFEAIK